MLEVGNTEEVMEKKSASRPSTGPAKADCKKSDNGNGKNTRFGRRREPNSSRPKYDQGASRRPVPQRSGGLDKRPRPRGFNGGRKTEEVTGEHGAEIGSALRPGGKKTNLNHLLNFTYEPRGQTNPMGRAGGGWKRRNNWSGKGGLRYNKEQFLQANCQFVVRDGKDYSLHAADPDMLVDWDLIEQVRIVSHEVPSCPICLYPPTAAKMTRCGHIYCWPCILHYLSLGDKAWRKCPICYDAVSEKDLKSVMALATHSFSPTEFITMKLMRREKGSTYAMPSNQWHSRDGQPHNIEDNVDVCYAKLLQATEAQIQALIDEEQGALLMQKQEEGDSLDGSYVQSALEQLNIRAEKLQIAKKAKDALEKACSPGSNSSSSSEDSTESDTSVTKPHAKVLTYTSAFDEEEAENDLQGAKSSEASEPEDGHEIGVVPDESERGEVGMSGADATNDCPGVDDATESLELPVVIPQGRRHEHRPGGKTTEYYFYQAEDGQHIYLNSVNARCMVHEYGSWENCPDTITASIVELEGVSMVEDLRRRLRYLGHLPLTLEFQVAELNLQPPTVSKATLQAFSDDLKKRERQRRNKVREDKKLSRKMQEVERRQMGMGSGLRVSLDSQKHFPQYAGVETYVEVETVQDGESIASSSLSSPRSTPVITPVGSPGLNPCAPEFVPGRQNSQEVTAIGSDDSQQCGGGMSFAQMLREGKSKGTPEAWGKPCPGTNRGVGPRNRGVSESDSDCEDRVPVPIFKASFGDAIQEAIDSFNLHEESVGTTGEVPTYGDATPEVSTSKGRKKKKIKKLLFTTTMPIAK